MKLRATVLTFALLAALGLAWPKTAAAWPYTYKGTLASYAWRGQDYLTSGTHWTVRVTNLSVGADPVLYILDPSGNDVGVHNDDCIPGNPSSGSCVTFLATTSGYYTFLVYAFSPADTGTADVTVQGGAFAYGIPIGGTYVAGVPNGNYIYETALTPGGSTDTFMWGFDCSTGNIVAWNDDGGVGLGSRFGSTTGAYNICNVLVGAYSSSTTGLTNLYVNDQLNDHDLDSLGANLENELQTCDRGFGYTGAYCAGVFLAKDTDRDGLPDDEEVLGVDGTGTSLPQYFPQYGANPRHKDIFVEADWWGQPTQPMTIADAVNLQEKYSVGSAYDLQNADGLGGVSIHVDLGIPSTGTLYGAWGGANQADTSDFQLAPTRASNFMPARTGRWHYQLFNATAPGGQGDSPGYRYYVGAGSGIAHELGHNLN